MLKLAVEAVGLSFDIFTSGTIKTALVKILGTDDFYWDGDAIVMNSPENVDSRIKIGQYSDGKYGIAVSSDGGLNWVEAVGFGGVSGGETVNNYYSTVEGEKIEKSETEPEKPSINALWIDTANKRLKLWDGESWVTIGYEPEETTDPTDPETPTEPEETGMEGE